MKPTEWNRQLLAGGIRAVWALVLATLALTFSCQIARELSAQTTPRTGGTAEPLNLSRDANRFHGHGQAFNPEGYDSRSSTNPEHGLRIGGKQSIQASHRDSDPRNSQPAVVSSSYHRAFVGPAEARRQGEASLEAKSWEKHSSPPQRAATEATARDSSGTRPRTPLLPPSQAGSQIEPTSSNTLRMLVSVGSSLMIVLGLFLGAVWFYRKSLGRLQSQGLPKSVVQVLGRTPVASRQQMVLIRFGSKLVLVNLVHGDARTISEITDPLEVDRLVGLCEGSRPGSSSASFRELLSQGLRS